MSIDAITQISLVLLQAPSEFNSAPIVVSVGSQLFAALVIGLLLAFGFQLLFTNLGVAVGISLFRFRGQPQPASATTSTNPSASSNSQQSALIRISRITAVGILLTINLVLFAACFLAVRVSQVQDGVSGAIFGVVIWAAYFLAMLWLSTSAASSLLSTILGFTVTGIGGLVALIRNLLKRNKTTSALDEKALSTIRQQVELTLDTSSLKQTLEDYLAVLTPPKPDQDTIRAELRDLFQQSELQALPSHWQSVDRTAIADLIKRRSNFTDLEIAYILDELEQVLPLTEQTQESDAVGLDSEGVDADLQAKVEDILQQVLQERADADQDPSWNMILQSVDLKQIVTTALKAQVEQLLLRGAGAALQQPHKTVESLRSLSQPLKAMQHQIVEKIAAHEPEPAPAEPVGHEASDIQAQLVSYLRYTSSKRLTPKRVERKLRKLLLGCEQSNLLDLSTLEAVLRQRQSIPSKQQRRILRQIEQIWSEIRSQQLSTATATDSIETIDSIETSANPLDSDRVQPESTESQSPQPERLEVLSDQLIGYFMPIFELSRASGQLKQGLSDWFSQHPVNAPGWLTMSEAGAESKTGAEPKPTVEKLTQGLEQWQHSVIQSWHEQLQQLDEALPSWLPLQSVSESTQTYLKSQLAGFKQQMSQQIETVQQSVQVQIDHLKQQTQQRLEATRRMAAAAAWWLLAIATTAALSSASAGALAGNGML